MSERACGSVSAGGTMVCVLPVGHDGRHLCGTTRWTDDQEYGRVTLPVSPLATVRELVDWIEAEPEEPLRVQERAREALAVLDSLDGTSVEHREGILEVYDWTGAYRGCIGVQTWEALLAARIEASQ